MAFFVRDRPLAIITFFTISQLMTDNNSFTVFFPIPDSCFPFPFSITVITNYINSSFVHVSDIYNIIGVYFEGSGKYFEFSLSRDVTIFEIRR